MAEAEVLRNEASENKENEGEVEEMMETGDTSDHHVSDDDIADDKNTSASPDVVAKKKGRGRPPKAGKSPKSPKTPSLSKKGRGRPKKVVSPDDEGEIDGEDEEPKQKLDSPKPSKAGGKKATKKKVNNTPTRTLGRPRKVASYKEKEEEDGMGESSDEETVKKGRGRPKSPSKGRGRPRKSGPSTSGTSGRKGRPKKSISKESDDWDSDFDDNVGSKSVKRIGRHKSQVKYTEESDIESEEEDYVQYTLSNTGRRKGIMGKTSTSKLTNGSAQKGRGRPKKSDTVAAPKDGGHYSDISDISYTESEAEADDSDSARSEGSVYKPYKDAKPHKVDAKGRGRPAQTSGKGRGRPSKSPKKGHGKPPLTPKRGRGRPKTTDVEDDFGSSDNSENEDEPQEKPKKAQGRPPKKGRGRPKKVSQEDDAGKGDKAEFPGEESEGASEDEDSVDELTTESPVKKQQKHGQKRPHDDEKDADGAEPDAPKKKGRGRPKKAKSEEVKDEDPKEEDEEEEGPPVLTPESTNESKKQESTQQNEEEEEDSKENEES